MGLLTNALRTAFSAKRPAEDADEAGKPLEVLGTPSAGAPAVAVPRAEGEQPAWKLLGAQTGVQDVSYGDIARPGVQHLFARPPRRLLDIGCASGAVAAGLKEADPALWAWGCELNAEAAAIAAGRLDHVTRVAREQWSAEDVALVGTVDTVLLLDVLEHMYNPWAELEFLSRSLPSDAQVIVSLPNVGHFSVLESLAGGAFPYAAMGILDVTHVRFFTLVEMQAMFRHSGFAIDDTWVLSGTAGQEPAQFPTHIESGKLRLRVDGMEQWQQLHAIQFGFRLRPRNGARQRLGW